MQGATILVVEDEQSISEVVTLYLTRSGYQVRAVHDGRAAIQALTEERPDLVILDLMLPEIDGWEITRRIRAEGATPIIILTARREESDRILGLEMGADDYVIKPFSPQELVSRVRAVLRRAQQPPPSPQSQMLTFPGLRIDPVTRIITVNRTELMLTAKEFDLLWFLASNPRRVFNRDQLLDHVWGETEYIDPSTVTVHVRRLREKIEADSSKPRYVHTVWGVGYKFEP